MNLKNKFLSIKAIKAFEKGWKMVNHRDFELGEQKSEMELKKTPSRTDVLNFLLSQKKQPTLYLEIGVRNPKDNFEHIQAETKYSVDPGVEFKKNPVDFQLTSDEFFKKLNHNEVLNNNIRFDVIFIDGLHLAEQVDRDIQNSLNYLKDDGFIVLHDCNPPTEFHARENYQFYYTPASGYWNGTTWKAFLKWRFNTELYSCCINTDWGVGILSKTQNIGKHINSTNPFFEYSQLDKNRKDFLNLIEFDEFKKKFH